jgi:hypothetical protein
MRHVSRSTTTVTASVIMVLLAPTYPIDQDHIPASYVTKRSWLDAGSEVFPGDRKFTDDAFPPGYSFGRENGNLPIDRELRAQAAAC